MSRKFVYKRARDAVVSCPTCKGRGYTGPSTICPMCKGDRTVVRFTKEGAQTK